MRYFSSAVLILLAGCASMSHRRCAETAWRAVGYLDGAAGTPAARAEGRRAACSGSTGSSFDQDAYFAGRREGLIDYCTAENGIAVGARGEVYAGVCQGDAGDRFAAAYSKGRRLFSLTASVIRLDQEIRDARSNLWEIKRRVSEVEALISAADTPHEDRLDLTAELASLNQGAAHSTTAIANLANEKSRAETRLAAFQALLANDTPAISGAVQPLDAKY